MSKIRVVAARDTDGEGLIIVGEFVGIVADTPSFTFPPESEEDVLTGATEIVEAVNEVCAEFGPISFPLQILPFSTIKHGKADEFIKDVVVETFFDAIVDIPGADTAQGWLDKAHEEFC